MSDPENPEMGDAVVEAEDTVIEEEDADLANASEWGDEEEDETMEEAAPNAGPTPPADESIPFTEDAADVAISSQPEQQTHQQTKQQRRDKKKNKRPAAGTLGEEDDYDNEDADEDGDEEDLESEEEETPVTGGASLSAAPGGVAEGEQQPGEAGGGGEDEQLSGQDSGAPERILGAHELWRQKVLGQLLDEQEDRFEHFRRSALDKGKMKKMLNALISATFRDNVATAVCGISKLYVGELIEAARVVATQELYVGPLLPHHIRTAFQRLQLRAKGGVQKQALRGRLLR